MQPLYKNSAYEAQAKQLSKQQQLQRNQQRNSAQFEALPDKQREGGMEKRYSGGDIKRTETQEQSKLYHEKLLAEKNSDVGSTISFEEEEELNEEDIHLMEDASDRTLFQALGDLFCIIKETEHLERAWRNASIKADDYTRECTSLINRYKTTCSSLKGRLSNPNHFIEDYEIEAPAARQIALIQAGVPAKVEHRERFGNQSDILYVTRATRTFITARNVLEMKLLSKDEIYPYISELIDALDKVERLRSGFEGKGRLKEWLRILGRMKASDSLSTEEARQLAFDLESAFTEFERILEAHS
ncbi:ESCRT-I complex subunit VPS28 [Galdieria sulphuraria]|uniref:ESCRT-I complex subunit VPS28 n=1 Tax=Galdieria sulphuraria TaxID=130081 RepID=M2Y2L4_GALSU|nr:ESCRT-I complex subunit VPS28 [Galdieria sulphuraria]EME30059.1 ESCRT-I complex subunit VPS28 [Galdieria sulphuraria]|eukprot:XP_005706579.1 ESCRT-I complex subunit VPS28 [Galdieria sulphuraria]